MAVREPQNIATSELQPFDPSIDSFREPPFDPSIDSLREPPFDPSIDSGQALLRVKDRVFDRAGGRTKRRGPNEPVRMPVDLYPIS